jgi:hypothetical protein
MFLDVETAEIFMSLLDSEKSKDFPIFLGQLTQTDQRGIAQALIVVQYQYDQGMIVRFKEVVGSAWLPRDVNDKHGSESSQELDKKAEEKKKTVETLLRQKGFNNIVPGIWMSL